MSLISEWSIVPAQNGTRGSPPNYWPEGQAPSTVNDCARLMMSTLRIQMQDAQWFNWGYTCTRIAGNKFGMNIGTNSATTSVVANFVANRRLKLYDTSTMYATISEASLSGSLINITVTMDSGSLTNSFSSAYLSILSPSNSAIPAVISPSTIIYQNGAAIYAASSTGNDTYVVSLTPPLTAYNDGLVVNIKVDVGNTGPATLNIDGLGAIAINKLNDQALITGDIEANQIISLVYNSTGPKFQMQSQLAQAADNSYVVLQDGSPIYGVDAQVTDAYAITLSPAPVAYTDGMEVRFKANTQNTTGATLNVNSLGAVAILKFHDQVLATGDIEAGQIVTVIYDSAGPAWQLQSAVAIAPGAGTVTSVGLSISPSAAGSVSGSPVTGSGTLALTTKGNLIGIQRLTSGTAATYTPTTGTTSALVYCQGGGGGAGGSTVTNVTFGAGAGGGGGGCAIKYITGMTGGYTATYTIGAAGTGGAAGANNGTDGGNTTYSDGTVSLQGTGGGGGNAGTATGGTGSALVMGAPGGGSGATGGDLNYNGQDGLPGLTTNAPSNLALGGSGGSSILSGGGKTTTVSTSTTTNGTAAPTNSGAGGSGGAGLGVNTNAAGGNGGAGIIIIYEYS